MKKQIILSETDIAQMIADRFNITESDVILRLYGVTAEAVDTVEAIIKLPIDDIQVKEERSDHESESLL